MPAQPPMRPYGGGPNNMHPQYQQQQPYLAGPSQHLPPPNNPAFMTSTSQQNSFNNPLSLLQGFAGNGMGGPGGGVGLASHDTQRAFAGANMQSQPNRDNLHDNTRPPVTNNKLPVKGKVREVWASNMEEEWAILRHLIDEFPYIALHIEFPGIVCRPMGAFTNKIDYHYQTMRINVDTLTALQIGITLFDADGKTVMQKYPAGVTVPSVKGKGQYCTWQFNFKFSEEEDMCPERQIAHWERHGVDLEKHAREGVDQFKFGVRLVDSGLIYNPEVTWVSFHGGYDFGFLYKFLQMQLMPEEADDWHHRLKLHFPNFYDLKYLIKTGTKHLQSQPPSSQDPIMVEILKHFEGHHVHESMPDLFRIDRVGRPHHAGPDSYINGKAFWEVKTRVYGGQLPADAKCKIWGLCTLESTDTTDTSSLTFGHSQPAGGRGDPSTPLTNSIALPNHTPSHTNAPPFTPQGTAGMSYGNRLT